MNPNPFNLNGMEAVIASGLWALSSSVMVYLASRMLENITYRICTCVEESVMAWADAFKQKWNH